ncbi:Cytochrome c oxidase subunit 4, mitochondrial [Vanrija pseudolonga]|uniref:Cytochrome c oxidase subunit 4, mitochondrial n=1 Tax=Vanrija pseudolonga TaxID=143232 RepID=A0AAF0Y5Z1_9TREE|nr:Cytochrome c oxidase subunit 4, mitochondrial [Vanrija pseudolonga]
MVALLRSLRAVARPALALPKAQVIARPISVSAIRRGGGGPPLLLGEGVKAGEVPTDEQQATGIERFELMGKVEGVDVFDMTPLQADRLGTLDNPIEVFSFVRISHFRLAPLWLANNPAQYPVRHVGCTGFPADSHDTLWLQVNTELKHHRCPECGSVYTLKYEPHASAAHH